MKNTSPRGRLTSGIFSLAAFLITVTMISTSLAQQPGSLDPTFRNGGKFTDWTGQARGIAIRPDGKIVVVGNSTYSPFDVAVARYNPDGSPDVTFGDAGKVSFTYSTGFTYVFAEDVAIQPDGRIVVTCYDDDKDLGAIVRLNDDGTLDASFGIGTYGRYSVAIQPDGKIITSGSESIFDYGIRRFNIDGSVDTTFGGGDGVTDLPIYPIAAVTQTDGRILAAGVTAPLSFAVARFNSDGTADESFDSDGLVTTSIGTDCSATSLTTLPDGRIVAVGRCFLNPGYTDYSLVRYNQNGSLDTTFDNDGIVALPAAFGWTHSYRNVAIQADGKVVVSGTSYAGPNNNYALIRYNLDGSLDSTFGDGDGIATVDFNNSNDFANGLAFDGQGRAVVVGTSDGAFAFARFMLEPGRAPFDFDADGRSDVSVYRPSDSAWYLNRSTQGFFATQFGLPTDKIAPADYDGDGKTDIAVFRDGVWWLRKSSNGAVEAITFGQASDLPVPADYTGDGRDELAVYRNGQWWSLDLSNNQSSLINFGLASDKPVPADYDGDGKVDQAVYRNGEWHINRSTLGYTVVSFGLPSDRPVVGDYDGDGRADRAVYRDGTWYLQQSTVGFGALQWGLSTDNPSPADYDGDGKTDAAVFRNGIWYQLNRTGGVSIQQFGLAGDKPIPSAYLQ